MVYSAPVAMNVDNKIVIKIDKLFDFEEGFISSGSVFNKGGTGGSSFMDLGRGREGEGV